jgi:hypothetical protein
VHVLVDQLPPVRLAALEGLLQSMLDPLPVWADSGTRAEKPG